MKQYLLLLNDDTRIAFQLVFPTIQLLEVQGMWTQGNVQVLATPVQPTVTPILSQDPVVESNAD